MTFQQRLTQLIDETYDSGYYAGRLMDKSLSDDDKKEYIRLREKAIKQRTNAKNALMLYSTKL